MKTSSILLSALLLSLVYVFTCSAPALALEEHVASETAVDEVEAASGSNRFVIWQDNGVGYHDIFFKRSTDNGATWKATVNLSNSAGVSTLPQITVSGSNVYVVWVDRTPGNDDIFFKRSTDNGATWKATLNLSNNATSSRFPQITSSGSNVYVVWQNGITNTFDIFFKRSTDNGATWMDVVNLSSNAGLSYNPQITSSGSNVYVVWEDSTPGSLDILSKRSTDNAATWKAVVNLSSNAGKSYESQITASGSNVYVVWQDRTPGNDDIFFKRSTDNGATWKATVNLSNNSGNSLKVQLAASGSNVYVVWQDPTSVILDIFFKRSTDNGATWKATVNLSSNAGPSTLPQIAASGSNVYVVWGDRTGNYEVFLRQSTDNGATWASVKNLSANAGYSLYPQVAA